MHPPSLYLPLSRRWTGTLVRGMNVISGILIPCSALVAKHFLREQIWTVVTTFSRQAEGGSLLRVRKRSHIHNRQAESHHSHQLVNFWPSLDQPSAVSREGPSLARIYCSDVVPVCLSLFLHPACFHSDCLSLPLVLLSLCLSKTACQMDLSMMPA